MTHPKPLLPWSAAVARILGMRKSCDEQAFETDALEILTAMKALVATGRCLVTGPQGRYLPVIGLRSTMQDRPGFSPHRKKSDPDALAHQAFALESEEGGSWIFNVARLTYLPSRRGAPPERAVFHLQLGPLLGVPFVNDSELAGPRLHFGANSWLLLTDADLDVPWLLHGDVNPADLDSLGQAVRGRPRASYVPPEERFQKEQAVAVVKTAYLTHRGTVRRALQQDDVDVIVRSGLAHGLLINLDLVHAATDGRGSPNAVYPKLADAMRRLAPGRPTAEDIDPALSALWVQLRTAAVASAEEQGAPGRLALETARATLASERDQLQAEREKDTRAALERQRQQERLDDELAQARERIESLTNVERGQASEIASLGTERSALREQLADAAQGASTLEGLLLVERHAYDTLKNTLTQLQREAATERVRAVAMEADLTAQRDRAVDAGVEQTRRRESVEQAHALTTQALQDSRLATTRAIDEHIAAKAALGAQRADASTARKNSETALNARDRQLSAQAKQLTQLKTALANERAEHQAVQRERNRLDALLTRIGTPPAQAN